MLYRLRLLLILSPTWLLPSLAGAADGFVPLAKQLNHSAQEADVRIMAVLPFLSLEGKSGPKGRLLAQLLSSRLAAAKGVAVLDPSRVDAAMKALSFKDADLVSPESLSKLARALDCQALATGSFSAVGTQALLRVRLYHAGSGLVLDDQDARLQAEWLARSEDLLPYDSRMTAAEALKDVAAEQGRRSSEPEKLLALSAGEQLQLRDSVANTACADSERMIHRLEASVLEQKAGYWASRVRQKKLSEKTALLKSETLLKDPLLRERYEQLFRDALRSARREPDPLGVQRFITYDRLAYELSERCR